MPDWKGVFRVTPFAFRIPSVPLSRITRRFERSSPPRHPSGLEPKHCLMGEPSPRSVPHNGTALQVSTVAPALQNLHNRCGRGGEAVPGRHRTAEGHPR